MTRLFPVAAGFATAALPDVAQSAIYIESGLVGCDQGCWNSTLDPTDTGYRAFAPFSPTATDTIGSVQWQGRYVDYDTPSNKPIGSSTASWQLDFYAEDAGAPGTLLSHLPLSAGSVDASLPGTSSLFGSTVDNCRFAGDLTCGFTVVAGTDYWLSVVSEQSTDNLSVGWTSSDDALLFIYQTYTPASDRVWDYMLGNNMNFTLLALPEPASVGLLAAMLDILGISRRRTGS